MAKKKPTDPQERKRIIRNRLIDGGVRNLKEFGYPGVNADNITTDMVYKQFFISILEQNLGHGFDSEINELIAECKKGDPESDERRD
jgi:hypothetical protein